MIELTGTGSEAVYVKLSRGAMGYLVSFNFSPVTSSRTEMARVSPACKGSGRVTTKVVWVAEYGVLVAAAGIGVLEPVSPFETPNREIVQACPTSDKTIAADIQRRNGTIEPFIFFSSTRISALPSKP
jgi:hypothetical protein